MTVSLRFAPSMEHAANSATGKGFMAFAMMGMDRRFASSCTFLCQLFETKQKLTPASLA